MPYEGRDQQDEICQRVEQGSYAGPPISDGCCCASSAAGSGASSGEYGTSSGSPASRASSAGGPSFTSPQTLHTMSVFTKTILYTAPDGRALWRDESVALTEGKPQARLSPLMQSGGYQLRESPVGFRSEFHCTENPQWVFILRGHMEIGLQDGSSRVFIQTTVPVDPPSDHSRSSEIPSVSGIQMSSRTRSKSCLLRALRASFASAAVVTS